MRAALSVAFVLLLAACAESTGPGADLRVETSKSVYPYPGAGNPDALVEYSVRNTGSTPVALPQCGTLIGELEIREAGEWVTVPSGQLCPLAIYAPLVLAPGEAAYGQISIRIAGRYRIRVDVAEEVGQPFSDYAVSPDFSVGTLEG